MRKKEGITKILNSQNGRIALIEYRHINVIRDNHPILKDINLSIGLGEHIAILGPNGAGKSFLIKTITQEVYPSFGFPDSYLRIMGRDLWNVFELRNLLGIVSNNTLDPRIGEFTGQQIILSGFFSSTGIWPHYHKVTAGMEQKTEEIMKHLEISHLSSRKMNRISTGEFRRILIGRALVHDPKALVLDEPNASLDFRASRELREMLRKIANAGTGIIIVTHDLTDIFPEITRVILLKDGSIRKDGGKEDVLTSGPLSDLFNTRLEVIKRDGYYFSV